MHATSFNFPELHGESQILLEMSVFLGLFILQRLGESLCILR